MNSGASEADLAVSEAGAVEAEEPVAVFRRRRQVAKIPKNPEEIFPEITADYRQAFGDGLLTIILYGSGVSDDYRPGISDLNFLMILDDSGLETLERAVPVAKKWKVRKVSAPLIMSRSELSSSLDSYPVEFLNMKNSHLLVYGEDVLQSLSFDPVALRLQIERELKGKLLLLRKSYLDTEGKGSALRSLVAKSLTAFTALFGALLYLKGREIPSSRRAVIKAMAWAFPIEPEVFLHCADIREREGRWSASEIDTLVRTCMKELSKLCEFVDRM